MGGWVGGLMGLPAPKISAILLLSCWARAHSCWVWPEGLVGGWVGGWEGGREEEEAEFECVGWVGV